MSETGLIICQILTVLLGAFAVYLISPRQVLWYMFCTAMAYVISEIAGGKIFLILSFIFITLPQISWLIKIPLGWVLTPIATWILERQEKTGL